MNVLFTCDENYIWLMGISMISLFENNRDLEFLNVYLLGKDISQSSKDTITQIAQKYQREVYIIDVPEFDIPKSLLKSRWPISAFTRLFSGILLPNTVDRILYLDCDTIVSGSIKELVDYDMGNYIVCGVKDCVGTAYKKNIGLDENSPYINAGVFLIDLKKLRDMDINAVLERYMNEYAALTTYADQDVLNGSFKGKIGVLSPKFNVMTIDVVYSFNEIRILRRPSNFYSEKEFSAINDPAIIHYTTNMKTVRPWYNNSNHPYVDKFLYYKSLSAWKDVPLKEMVFTTSSSKVIGIINVLPKPISMRVLGIIHSYLRPLYLRMKSKKS